LALLTCIHYTAAVHVSGQAHQDGTDNRTLVRVHPEMAILSNLCVMLRF
jgi:hypothetical protein